MTIRARPWSSKSPGQRHRSVHRRPRKSSRIWDLGYKIGYMNSVLAWLKLCDSRMRTVRHSKFESKVDERASRGLGCAHYALDSESTPHRLDLEVSGGVVRYFVDPCFWRWAKRGQIFAAQSKRSLPILFLPKPGGVVPLIYP